MDVRTHILLRCPDCKREMEVKRDEHDYPEAVRVEVQCDKCDDGDFAEVMHFDANDKHITRDPSLPANTQVTRRTTAHEIAAQVGGRVDRRVMRQHEEQR